ncbi:MAG TPA: hypothetical protein VK421_07060 [Pyrinomonadaceae bacterium]|nr:hypothetical protein [Pyrinomonadaceae bacterium]
MKSHESSPEITIGKGSKWGLTIVALFLAGMAVGGPAVTAS